MDIAALKARANPNDGLILNRAEANEFVTACRNKIRFVCCSTKSRLNSAITALDGELKNTNNTDTVRVPPANYPVMFSALAIGKK